MSATAAVDAAASDAAELLDKINLVELLKEQLLLGQEGQGASALLPRELSNDELARMSPAAIRRYMQPQQAGGDDCDDGGAAQPPPPPPPQQPPRSFPPPDAAAFAAWFPAAARADAAAAAAAANTTSAANAASKPPPPTGVILCFHPAGGAEDIFTSEGTGARRQPSPLLAACRANGWRLLAAQLPGRNLRLREPRLRTLAEAAAALVPLVAPAIAEAGGRYAVVGHSVGAWLAYETVLALRSAANGAGLPGPAAACLSAMPWPHIPGAQRPWRRQALLDEAGFQAECRAWDVSEAVFADAATWAMYGPLLRADFRLFDEYTASAPPPPPPSPSSQPLPPLPFDCPLRLFWGSDDRRVSEAMVRAWAPYTSAAGADAVVATCVKGGSHLFPLQPPQKQAWLRDVAAALEAALVVGGV